MKKESKTFLFNFLSGGKRWLPSHWSILEEFNGYQDPGRDISAFITGLTGISDDMAKGQTIDESAVAEYLEDVDLIIAHNAKFDRSFFEITFPNIKPKAWACSSRVRNSHY